MFENLEIEGAVACTPAIHNDSRGAFFESWRQNSYPSADGAFVQDNFSYSNQHVLRGLHYQSSDAQGQLVTLVSGHIQDVLVDVRTCSKTFGKWISLDLSANGVRQVYMPPGVAHGFCVLSENAILHYKCSKYYNTNTESGLKWNDPDLGISWKVSQPVISQRDQDYPCLRDVPYFRQHIPD